MKIILIKFLVIIVILNNNNDILNNKRPFTEYVDVDKLSPETLYDNCISTLEFFIVSLCKIFKNQFKL